MAVMRLVAPLQWKRELLPPDGGARRRAGLNLLCSIGLHRCAVLSIARGELLLDIGRIVPNSANVLSS